MTKLLSSLSIDGNPSGKGRSLLHLLAAGAALVGTLLYIDALHNPFTYDDYRLIVENSAIQDLSNPKAILLRDITRPVVNLSYAIDTAIWGSAPFGYHLTNILLHAVNVVLVFWITLLACEDRQRQRVQYLSTTASPAIAAFAAALLFAVHPMMTQAVGYISGRSEVAYCCIFMLAFLAGRRWMLDAGRRWWIACVILWATGVLTKETGAMLPFVLLSYDWLVLDAPPGQRRRRFLAMGLPLITVTIAAAMGRIAVLWFVEYGSVRGDWRFGVVAADAFWRYVSLFASPQHQTIFHTMPMPDEAAPLRMLNGVVGIMALPLAAWGLRRAQSVMAFGGLWFLLLLVPSSVLFALGVGEPLAEHRAYVSAAGLFLIWGSVFAMLWERTSGRVLMRGMLATIAALFVAQLSMRTLTRNAIWANPVKLARESVALAPDHWVPRLLLGEALRQAGRCDDAIPKYRQVIAMRPREEDTYVRLAGCLIHGHRFDEAETSMRELKAVNPASHDAAMTLGVLAALRNQPERARAYFAEASSDDPASVDAGHMLAFVDGTLPVEEHRQVCDELHAMAESFDVTACRGWQGGRGAVVAPVP